MNKREASKTNWNSHNTVEDINSGSLQRIADACEIMASNYVALQNEVTRLKESRQYYVDRVEKLERRVTALKGVITKLKNRKP